MKSKIGDIARLQHIYDAILEIEDYTLNCAYDEFQQNSMMPYASVKQLEIIGEAANHIIENFKVMYHEIKWRKIIGLRDLLIHEYFGIDTKIIWDIIKGDIRILKEKIEILLHQLNPQ